jgi:hypothetical protein
LSRPTADRRSRRLAERRMGCLPRCLRPEIQRLRHLRALPAVQRCPRLRRGARHPPSAHLDGSPRPRDVGAAAQLKRNGPKRGAAVAREPTVRRAQSRVRQGYGYGGPNTRTCSPQPGERIFNSPATAAAGHKTFRQPRGAPAPVRKAVACFRRSHHQLLRRVPGNLRNTLGSCPCSRQQPSVGPDLAICWAYNESLCLPTDRCKLLTTLVPATGFEPMTP